MSPLPGHICSAVDLVERYAKLRKPGYLEACRAGASPLSPPGCLCWDQGTYERLKAQYTIPSPSLHELAANFSGSLIRWAAAGFPITTTAEWQHRLGTCRACPQWSEDARRGLGKCAICKCTKVKHWLATETCPAGLW